MTSYLLRASMAVLGGMFLVAPMLIIVLHNTQVTALVTRSVCVFVFGLSTLPAAPHPTLRTFVARGRYPKSWYGLSQYTLSSDRLGGATSHCRRDLGCPPEDPYRLESLKTIKHVADTYSDCLVRSRNRTSSTFVIHIAITLLVCGTAD